LGGSELFNLEYLRHAHQAGIQIDALVPGRGALERELLPFVRKCEIVAVPQGLQSVSRFQSRVGIANAARIAPGAVAYGWRLRRALVRTEGPIVCFGLRSQLAVAALAPSLNREICWVVVEVVPNGILGRAWGRASRTARHLWAQSRAAADQPLLQGAAIEILPVRLPLARFETVPPPRDPPRVLGLIGDLFPLKNHLAMFELVRRLRGRGFAVEGVIVGRDQAGEKHAVEEYARAVHAAADARDSHVRVVAAAPEQLPDVLAEIDVLLHLSTIPETFGRVCAEAMAAGRPVVGFGHGAVAEIVKAGETGLLCPPGDLDAVEAALVDVYRGDGMFRRLSAQAREHAHSEFGEGQTNRTIAEALVERAVAGSTP
jgi:glycosyltransferase involved in cell wall biosynthesis